MISLGHRFLEFTFALVEDIRCVWLMYINNIKSGVLSFVSGQKISTLTHTVKPMTMLE